MCVQCPQILTELSLWITAALTVSSPHSETRATQGNGCSITKKRLYFIPGLLGVFSQGGTTYLCVLPEQLEGVALETMALPVQLLPPLTLEPDQKGMDQIAFYHTEN